MVLLLLTLIIVNGLLWPGEQQQAAWWLYHLDSQSTHKNHLFEPSDPKIVQLLLHILLQLIVKYKQSMLNRIRKLQLHTIFHYRHCLRYIHIASTRQNLTTQPNHNSLSLTPFRSLSIWSSHLLLVCFEVPCYLSTLQAFVIVGNARKSRTVSIQSEMFTHTVKVSDTVRAPIVQFVHRPSNIICVLLLLLLLLFDYRGSVLLYRVYCV